MSTARRAWSFTGLLLAVLAVCLLMRNDSTSSLRGTEYPIANNDDAGIRLNSNNDGNNDNPSGRNNSNNDSRVSALSNIPDAKTENETENRIKIASQSAEKPIRVCTQKERLEHMRKICFQRSEATAQWWMNVSGRSLVDLNHKVMMCWMSKAGCTAFKALFLEAAGFHVSERKFGHSLMTVHVENILEKHGLKRYDKLPENATAEVLANYFTFILIRHPLQRLLSTYRGKVLDTGSDFPWFGAEALKLAHPDLFRRNETLAKMKAPQKVLGPPTFEQFLDWIRRTGEYNDHWSMIQEACHPCAQNWSAILRLETMERDGGLLLDRLKPDVNISRIPVRHSHQHAEVHDHFSMRLPEYDDVKEEIIGYFLHMYKTDMEMFGYGWNKTTHAAYCRIRTKDGPCC